MIDWSSLSPSDFERFSTELLRLNGFENIEWYGKGGGDKGRDLVATKSESPLPGVHRSRSWVIQCRRYTKRTISKGELAEFLEAAREHKPDVVLLILTSTMTSDVRDWLKSVVADYRFEIYWWEERDLEREIRRHGAKLTIRPKVIPGASEPIWFYESSAPGILYLGGIGWEFEEVGFYLLNSHGPNGNREILRRFVEFIRHNDIQFLDDDHDKKNGDVKGTS